MAAAAKTESELPGEVGPALSEEVGMLHKSRLAVAACCVAVTVLAGTPAPVAVAAEDTPSRVVLHDGSGDVWKVNLRTSHWTPVGERPAADVRRAAITHRARAVVLRTRFVNLRRIGVQTFWAGIETPAGDYYTEVTSKPGNRAGRHALYDEPGGQRTGCAGLSHRIDYPHDTVTVRVPRSCLDRPRWVSLNIGNILVVDDAPHRHHYADNPHDDGPYSNLGTRRIYRGQA